MAPWLCVNEGKAYVAVIHGAGQRKRGQKTPSGLHHRIIGIAETCNQSAPAHPQIALGDSFGRFLDRAAALPFARRKVEKIGWQLLAMAAWLWPEDSAYRFRVVR
jgi:hypothetical protein